MNTYEFTQAFINANDAVLNHVDAIEETRALSELIDACKERMAEIKPEAVELAQKVMAENHVDGSEFEYKGISAKYHLHIPELFYLMRTYQHVQHSQEPFCPTSFCLYKPPESFHESHNMKRNPSIQNMYQLLLYTVY